MFLSEHLVVSIVRIAFGIRVRAFYGGHEVVGICYFVSTQAILSMWLGARWG
jgi:hypothetical protein